MTPITTRGIVLARVNYQEADRILTIITDTSGKLHLIAKGVRKAQSKLAGGVELFSISEISFIHGKGEVGMLVSSRLQHHFGEIVKDIDRTMYAQDFLKIISKVTEDNADHSYFDLTSNVLAAINDETIDLLLIKLWADMQLLKISGHEPNLAKDHSGKQLTATAKYDFDASKQLFIEYPGGVFSSGHIKLLRLVASHPIQKLAKVSGLGRYIETASNFATAMRRSIFHV